MPTPEQQARATIDALLQAAAWHVCNGSEANIHAARGVAIRDQSARQPIGTRVARPKGAGTRTCRRQFGKGNDFTQKITDRTTGVSPKVLRDMLSWTDRIGP